MLHYRSRVKGKVYKTVVRPAMMYGAETWAVKKTQQKKLDVAEMRMLRWMSGVTNSPQHKHWPTGPAHFSDRRASTGQYIVSFTGPAGPLS